MILISGHLIHPILEIYFYVYMDIYVCIYIFPDIISSVFSLFYAVVGLLGEILGIS